MAMVEPEFCFLQMRGKVMFCYAMELSQAMLGIAPEGLNPIYML
jgi:hypothetical protein